MDWTLINDLLLVERYQDETYTLKPADNELYCRECLNFLQKIEFYKMKYLNDWKKDISAGETVTVVANTLFDVFYMMRGYKLDDSDLTMITVMITFCSVYLQNYSPHSKPHDYSPLDLSHGDYLAQTYNGVADYYLAKVAGDVKEGFYVVGNMLNWRFCGPIAPTFVDMTAILLEKLAESVPWLRDAKPHVLQLTVLMLLRHNQLFKKLRQLELAKVVFAVLLTNSWNSQVKCDIQVLAGFANWCLNDWNDDQDKLAQSVVSDMIVMLHRTKIRPKSNLIAPKYYLPTNKVTPKYQVLVEPSPGNFVMTMEYVVELEFFFLAY